MKRPFLKTTLSLGTAIVLTCLWSAPAGDLIPPAGPVAPTMKALTDIEPRTAINASNTPGDSDSLFKVIAPGSYYLTGNITGVVGKHGIEIVASGVTLDLNGFDLVGVPGSLDGVSVTVTGLINIAVVNGSVRNWGGDGVDISSFVAENCRVKGVLAGTNGGEGIITSFGCTVTNCSAFGNSFSGIFVGNGSTVTHCSAFNNSASGISAGNGCTVIGCSGYSNANVGIGTSGTCTVADCAVYANTGTGISTGNGCTITHCSAQQNTGNGISTINGISTSSGCTIADCTVRGNVLDGIRCTAACVIRGNTCDLNGSGGDGADIHVTGGDNRIEGNNCTTADRGIDVDTAGNIIVRNTCSGNTTNWDVVAGNVILVVSTIPAAAVTGNFGGTAPGSTDPSANFTY